MGDQSRGPYGRTHNVHKGNHCEFVIMRKTKEICQWGQKIVMKKVDIKTLPIHCKNVCRFGRNCQYCKQDLFDLNILSVIFSQLPS